MNQIHSRIRTVTKTGDTHMLFHEGPVPPIEPLPAELYRVGLFNVPGDQYNPSVFMQNGVLKVTVRVWIDARTINYVARVADDWTLLNVKQIRTAPTSVVRGPIRTPLSMSVPPLEDLRPFMWQGKLWALGVTHDNGVPIKWIRQVLLELSDDGSQIMQFHVLQSVRYEKNWMPCVKDTELVLIYSTDPLITMSVLCGVPQLPSANDIPQATGYIRGGSQLLPYEDGYLAVVHEVYKPKPSNAGHNPLMSSFWAPHVEPDPVAGTEKTVYVHRFAKFNSDLTTAELSKPFYWAKIGIEFCAGLVKRDDKFVASFGVADKEVWLAEFNDDAVKQAFAPVDENI